VSATAQSSRAERSIVGIGYCSYDYLAIVPERPAFDADALTLADLTTDGGGPVSTALVAAARLGASTAYIGILGDDIYGQALASMFAAEGVDCARLRTAPGCRSQTCIVLVEQATGRRSILCHRPTYPRLSLEEADLACIASARALHLDGHHIEAAIEAARFARLNGILVCLDANRPRPALNRLLPHVDLLIAAEPFPSAYTGITDSWKAIAQVLTEGPCCVVVTQGERGCLWATATDRGETPSFQVPVVDTTGAGDAFHGAFLFAWLQGWPIAQASEFSAAVAAINCMQLGGRSGLPTLQQTIRFLQDRSHHSGTWSQFSATGQ
jgi:sugar/nucleoside kinase (ribokinase family)